MLYMYIIGPRRSRALSAVRRAGTTVTRSGETGPVRCRAQSPAVQIIMILSYNSLTTTTIIIMIIISRSRRRRMKSSSSKWPAR